VFYRDGCIDGYRLIISCCTAACNDTGHDECYRCKQGDHAAVHGYDLFEGSIFALITVALRHGVLPRSGGRRGNQNFVQVPYHSMCELIGIRFDDSHSEAYTSQVDALALDPIKKPPYGRKRRVKRGLYQSAPGTLINADVNGALNHLRKMAGDSVIPRIIGRGRVNR